MYSVFEQLLQKHGVSTYKVAKATGIPQQTFSKWKQGKSTPKADKLQKIADYFNVTLAYILGHTDEPTELSIDEQLDGIDFALYGEIKELTDEQKQEILDFVRFKKQQEK